MSSKSKSSLKFLTNERLSKRFDSPFTLVNYAIDLAKNYIDSGRPPRLNLSIDNPAYLILQEIQEGLDKFVTVQTETDRAAKGHVMIAQKGAELVRKQIENN